MKMYRFIGGSDTYTLQKQGTWYDIDYKKQAISLIDPNIKKDDSVNAIITPHAGYRYSGKVIGTTYSYVNWDLYDRIIMLCTLHKGSKHIILPKFTNVIGEIDVDEKIVSDLVKNNKFIQDNDSFIKEHSFDLQLPFILSFAKKGTKIIPMLVGDADKDVARTLSGYINNSTLIIVTSDFTHSGPRYPDTIGPYDEIKQKDKKDIDAIIHNKIDKFEGIAVCGEHAIRLFMMIRDILDTNRYVGKLVSYGESDKDGPNIVTYAGLIFTDMSGGDMYDIWDMANKRLENIPRQTLILLDKIVQDITNVKDMYEQIRRKVIIQNNDIPVKGVFVTFEEDYKLQGCIGIFYEQAQASGKDMIELVMYYTLQTVFSDSRFPNNSLKAKENYKDLYSGKRYNFKINILEANFKVDPNKFWDVYIPCTHGIVLGLGGRRATFLPSVMKDQNWIENCDKVPDDAKDKFEQKVFGSLIRKMGFSKGNWKDGTVYLYVGTETNESFL